MNRERIEKLRDFLRDEVLDSRFGMELFIWRKRGAESLHGSARSELRSARARCGTAACVAGWGALLFLPDEPYIGEFDVGDTLGLTTDQAKALFLPPGFGAKGAYPRARAVATLTRLLETGEVDWDEA